LLLGLITLPLPWVEIQCVAKSNTRRVNPRIVIVRQNAVQTMTGEFSYTDDYDKLISQVAKEPGEPGRVKENSQPVRSNPALLVIAWAALLVLGALLGFALRAGRRRAVLLTFIATAALACLVSQGFILGFPLKAVNDWPLDEWLDLSNLAPDDAPKKRPEVRMERAFGLGFWLAIILSAGALAGGVVEWMKSSAWWNSTDDKDITRLCYGTPTSDSRDSTEREGMISYQCPECSAALHARQEAARMTIRCQKCRSMITVPSRSDR